MYRVLLVIPLLMIFSACAPAPGDFEDTADFEMAELDLEDLGMSSDREALKSYRCPSVNNQAFRAGCSATAWGPPSLAIAECVADINASIVTEYASVECAKCKHGKDCERVLPLFTLHRFSATGSRCRITALPFGFYSAICPNAGLSGKFSCVETDRKPKDTDEYLDELDEYPPVY